MGRKVYIIYHAGCFDGVAGAWVVKKKVEENWPLPIEIVLHPAKYGDPPPDVTDCIVYVVDFSYPREILVEMNSKAEWMHVIDHHHTAQEALQGLGFCTFDMNRSGAGLAWDILFPYSNRPWLIIAVEDRDLWKFKIPSTKAVIAYLAAHPLTLDNIEETMKHTQATIVEKGLGILDYIDTFGEKVCETWTIKKVAGYDVPVINTPYMNCSDHLEKLSQKLPGHPFYVSFFMLAGGRWQFSLRSKSDFDVSAIAKLFGGGGHKPAAGFTVDVLPWMADAQPVLATRHS